MNFQPSLFTNSYNLRLAYHPIVSLELTGQEFENKENDLSISYSFADSLFGKIIIASTPTGICRMDFIENEKEAFENLQKQFPYSTFVNNAEIIHQQAIQAFTPSDNLGNKISLHVKGTEFQIIVWKYLLNIPFGQITTYGVIAKEMKNPGASRAIGSAIGANPVAYLIPCHRVVQLGGKLGGYMWGLDRKKAILRWEAELTILNKSQFENK